MTEATYCGSCRYSYSHNNCEEKIKLGCPDCPMSIDEVHCKCSSHGLTGKDCPDYSPLENDGDV